MKNNNNNGQKAIITASVLVALILLGAAYLVATTSLGGEPGSASAFPLANFIVLAIAAVVAAFLLPRYLSHRAAIAQLKAKDDVITTNEQSIASLEERIASLAREKEAVASTHEQTVAYLRQTVRNLEEKEQELASCLGEWKGKYEEQQKYTAQPAFDALTGRIEEAVNLSQQEAERRHREVMRALDVLAQTRVERGERGPRGDRGDEGQRGNDA